MAEKNILNIIDMENFVVRFCFLFFCSHLIESYVQLFCLRLNFLLMFNFLYEFSLCLLFYKACFHGKNKIEKFPIEATQMNS